MKRLLVAVVIVGMVFSGGMSFAQEEAPQMPDKVRNFLEKFVGSWSIKGEPVKGTAVYKWDVGKNYVIGTGDVEIDDVPLNDTSLWRWDGISQNGIIVYSTSSGGHAIDRLRIVSETVIEGRGAGVQDGKKGKGKMRVEHRDSDQFTMVFTDGVAGDEKQPDWTGVFTKIKPTSREDFEEYCKLNQGRWVGKVTQAVDVPGARKKGDEITVHVEHTITTDGNAMATRSYGGEECSSGLTVYDPVEKKIINRWVSSSGATGEAIAYKSEGKWHRKVDGCLPDGTRTTVIYVITTSDNGNKGIVKGSGMIGDEKFEVEDRIWHRVGK